MKRLLTMMVTVSAGIVLAALSGCASGPCPAIGWVNTLTVELTGARSQVHTVQLCTNEGCAPGTDLDPSSQLNLIALAEQEDGTWTFETDMLTLEEVTVRTLDAGGAIVSDHVVTPEWKRIGGSDACGGPAAAVVKIQTGYAAYLIGDYSAANARR